MDNFLMISFVVSEQLIAHLFVVPALAHSAAELLVERFAQQHDGDHQSADNDLKKVLKTVESIFEVWNLLNDFRKCL
jgi:hypothetical protein